MEMNMKNYSTPAEIAEVTIDSLTVRHRRLRGITVLEVDGSFRRPPVHGAIPPNAPIAEIQAVDLPLMFRRGWVRAVTA